MKRKEVRLLIQELDDRMNQFASSHNLFYGGCCWAAYVLARELTRLGIRYETVVYQYNSILNVNRFNKAINGKGVAHVSIQVTCGKDKMVIGNPKGVVQYFKWVGKKYNVKTYHRISPEEILSGYRNNSWNHIYNTHCNGPLSRVINNICNKYSEIR